MWNPEPAQPQNSHKYPDRGQDCCSQLHLEHGGKENVLVTLLILAPASLSHLGFLWTVRMVTLRVQCRQKCRCAHPASRRERQCPSTDIIPLLQIPTLQRLPCETRGVTGPLCGFLTTFKAQMSLPRVIKEINALKIKRHSNVPMPRAVRVLKIDPFGAAIKEHITNF